MANILILTSYYLQKDNVLSNNVTKIVDELSKNNNVLCISEDLYKSKPIINGNLRVISTKTSYLTRKILITKENKYIWFNRIKALLLFWNYPNIDIALTKRKKRIIEREMNDQKFDVIISFYREYSNIQILLDIKKKCPDVKTAAVFMDLLEAYVPFGFTAEEYYDFCSKLEEKLLNKNIYCFFPANHENTIMRRFGEKWSDRIRIFDYPLYKYCGKKAIHKQGKIKLLYAGTVDINYRNPLKLLNVLNELGLVCDSFEVDMYVGGNCVQMISEFAQKSNFKLNVYGFISHDELINKMEVADVLINICNYQQNAVPSKIFEIASFAKPILNYSFTADDYSNRYFDKYPLVYIIKAWENQNSTKNDLADFILSSRERIILRSELDKIFLQNTAKYFVELLAPLIEGESR